MIRARHLRLGFIPLVLCFVLLAGCSGSSRVEGTVTLDGQPVDGGTITFFPEGGGDQKNPNVPGQIINGKYSIDSAHKLAPGNYKVEVYWFKKTGKTISNPNDPGTTIEEAKQVIPDEFNKSSKLKAEISSGSNTVNFELKSGGVISGSGPAGPGAVGGSDETQPKGKKRPNP